MTRCLTQRAAGVLTLWLVISAPSAAWAGGGWVVYWDGSYHGQVLEAETKAPLEGVVVVAVYHESCYRFIQTNSKEIGVQEVLTDATGKFRIPAFWTVSTPDCWFDDATFTVFKPWYGPFPSTSGLAIPVYTPSDPKENRIAEIFRQGAVVELPRLNTTIELRNNRPYLDLSSERLQRKLREFNRLEEERREELGYVR